MGGRDRTDEDQARAPLKTRPFAALKELKRQVRKTPKPPPREKPAPRVDPVTDADEDKLAFSRAMAGVTPLAERKIAKIKSDQLNKKPRTDAEAAAVDAYLRDLIDGVLPFDIADTDEYIEGAVEGLDRRLLRRLRRGEFALQAHLDLHGHRRDEARDEVAKFIKKSWEKGHRCVLIVHGRGLNSKNQIPVLKEKLKAWLTRGAIGTKVLAFASARPYDGGTGAVYVLLRR